MEEKTLGKIMAEELVFAVFKQDVKEAVDFAQKRALHNAMAVALDPGNIARVKQTAKEAIEFASANIKMKLPPRELKIIVPKEERGYP